MKIYIELTSWFARFTDGNTHFCIDVEERLEVLQIVSSLGIPIEQIGFLTLNDIKIDEDAVLKDGDVVKVYTSIVAG